MEYLSSKNKSMHCRGDAGSKGQRSEGRSGGGVALKGNVTFDDVDALPLRRVFLRVVGGGEIPSVRFFHPGSTLSSWGHT